MIDRIEEWIKKKDVLESSGETMETEELLEQTVALLQEADLLLRPLTLN